jgi:outer membrane protein
MKKINLSFTIFIIILTYCCVSAAEEMSLTLDEAIGIALRDNRDVLLKMEDLKKAKAKVAEAQSGVFPTLNLTASRSDTRGYYSKDLDQTTTQGTLKQYLYKGGKTVNTIKQSKDKLKVSQALLEKARIETVLNVKKAFYTLMLAGELTGLNKGILDNTKAHLDFMNARYNSGQASGSEVLKIQEAISNIEQIYEGSKNQAESSRVLLRNLLYLDDGIKIKSEGQFIYDEMEVAYDEAFLNAMAKRPEIEQYEAQESADKKAIEMAKADNKPNIYVSWDYYARSHVAVGTSRNWGDYNVIGATFTWPVFDGWLTKAKVEQAIVDLEATRLNKEKVIKDIALELKNSYLDLKTALVKIKAVKSQLDLYKDTLSSVEDKYKSGIASSLDLDDASLAYQISLFNQKQAIYDYLLAKARFEKAMGGT